MDASQIQNLSPQQREELMKNVQAQVALAQMQELLTVSLYFIGLILRLLWKIQFIDLQKTTDKCFKKCVSSPSSSLGSGEQVKLELDIISADNFDCILKFTSFQRCLAMCMDRYIDSFNLVSRAYTQRLQQESGH